MTQGKALPCPLSVLGLPNCAVGTAGRTTVISISLLPLTTYSHSSSWRLRCHHEKHILVSHRVILELTLGEGEEEPDDGPGGLLKRLRTAWSPWRRGEVKMKMGLELGTPGVQVRSGIFGAPKAQLRAFPLSILSPGVRERKSISAPSRDQAARSCEDNQAEQAIGKPFIKAKQETSLLCCYTGGQKSEMPLSVSGVSSCISPHPSPSPYRAAPQTLLLPDQPNRTLGPRNWRKWRADMRVHP
ncbi:uncharacterized protein LOC107504999 [Rousettus aegyptiacus]|uniref:uncharacterized protein LOC107504999 n=1 Tax=Rousettus aegyptiacus TaxID=9407 RepID=UPI00168D6EEA|nr:uncharacterized protein LOC107504999 [Rousettus aegyptiacus]